jgi:cytochrome P450
MTRQQGQGRPPPIAEPRTGLKALRGLLGQRSLLPALEAMYEDLGSVFQITLPGFRPVIVVGPEANRTLLVTDREKFLWRNERDPVARLLGRGLLVEDGQRHDDLRALMRPYLQRPRVLPEVGLMGQYVDLVLDGWGDDDARDMLVEMRRLALLIVMGVLFRVEMLPDLDRLFPVILRALDFIAPGLWIVWPEVPRPGYGDALEQLDEYLYGVIRERRATPPQTDDLLSALVATPWLDDQAVRDQLLTLMIAGHDTSTASLAWTLYLLGRHPEALARAQAEVDSVLAGEAPAVERLSELVYLEQVFWEALRLYPPIHIGNRLAATDLEIGGYEIKAGTRVMYSIYLAHRSEQIWDEPLRFWPERFAKERRGTRPPLSYVPFGGGPRNCIGAGFAQVEAKVVLARVLQTFDLQLVSEDVHPHMGAALEPRPGVVMRVRRHRSEKGQRPAVAGNG